MYTRNPPSGRRSPAIRITESSNNNNGVFRKSSSISSGASNVHQNMLTPNPNAACGSGWTVVKSTRDKTTVRKSYHPVRGRPGKDYYYRSKSDQTGQQLAPSDDNNKYKKNSSEGDHNNRGGGGVRGRGFRGRGRGGGTQRPSNRDYHRR